MSNAYKIIASPVGDLTLIASDKGLMAILWENDDPARVKIDAGEQKDDHVLLCKTEKQLREYFSGERKKFEVPLDFYLSLIHI